MNDGTQPLPNTSSLALAERPAGVVALPPGESLHVEPGTEYWAEVRIPQWAVVTAQALADHLSKEVGFRALGITRKRPKWWPAPGPATYYVWAVAEGQTRTVQLPTAVHRIWRVDKHPSAAAGVPYEGI
jgi:hypothetical protein